MPGFRQLGIQFFTKSDSFLFFQMKSFLTFFNLSSKRASRIIQSRWIRTSRVKFSEEDDLQNSEYEKLVNESGVNLKLPAGNKFFGLSTATDSGVQFKGHNVFCIHPKIRWGSKSASINTTPELQLEEAVSLVRTLPGFNVVTWVFIYFIHC